MFMPPVGVAEPTNSKLAHVIRVLLAKWMTMLRSGIEAPLPTFMEPKSSWNFISKESPVILPYLPLRSPTWHV